MENVDQSTKEKIIALISALIPKAKIILFGSRARGTHTQWSDIDLALDSGKQLPIENVDEIRRLFEASNLLYKVEVVDLYQVPQNMKEIIEKEGVIWKP